MQIKCWMRVHKDSTDFDLLVEIPGEKATSKISLYFKVKVGMDLMKVLETSGGGYDPQKPHRLHV